MYSAPNVLWFAPSPSRALAVFYALALVFSWTLWAPWVLSTRGGRPPSWTALHLVGTLGPCLAALLVVGRDRAGLRQLFGPAVERWRLVAAGAPLLVPIRRCGAGFRR